jgi:ribosomal protein S18 acetylase RimI-like enzyme
MPQPYLDGLDMSEWVDTWRRRLGAPSDGSTVLVAMVDHLLAGFAAIGRARDVKSDDAGELYAINVHPDYWRTGVGTALLAEAQRRLADHGYRRAVLWVLPGNVRARRFYERHGWKLEGAEHIQELRGGVTVAEVRYGTSLLE